MKKSTPVEQLKLLLNFEKIQQHKYEVSIQNHIH